MKTSTKTALLCASIFFTLNGHSSSFEKRKQLREALLFNGVKSLLKWDNAFEENSAQFELGRNLFFDKVLSGNKNISCASCHSPSMGTSDLLPVSVGEGGIGLGLNRRVHQARLIPRNSPALFNKALFGHTTVMWDGRIKRARDGELTTPETMLNGHSPKLSHIVRELKSTLAAQALFPITSHDEMRGQRGTNEIANANSNHEVWQKITKRVTSISGYQKLLSQAYPLQKLEDINIGHLANAIGVYEGMAFRATNTPFDKFMAGKNYELTDSQVRGGKVFVGKGQCIQCHRGPFLSDFESHSIGVPHIGPGKTESSNDRGLELLTGLQSDRYKFKTPPLRNVALTAPYMHNGFFTSLRDAVKFHCHPDRYFAHFLTANSQMHSSLFYQTIDRDLSRSDERLLSTSPILRKIPSFTKQDLDDVISFLHSLTDKNSLGRPLGGIPQTVPSGLSMND